MTSREMVYRTLEMKKPPRAPRDLWILSWAYIYHKDEAEEIHRRFPSDMTVPPDPLLEYPPASGNAYEPGVSTDAWGCKFVNIQRGVHGEVKEPLVCEDDWSDAGKIRFPKELLSVNRDKVNRFCASSDKFIFSECVPRPFEQLQFMRGTERFFYDIMDQPPKMMSFIATMHEFYCELLSKWAKTDVDSLNMMDDWGSQNALLINPQIWRQVFGPMYKDYIDIAHSAGKKAFMHSDGHILEIYPDLIGMGLDAINSQIFCMGIDNLKQYAGKITFWGEMDRQHLLPHGTPDEINDAVAKLKENLWTDGGCIAQLEFSAGTNPANVALTFEAWDRITECGE